MKSIPLAIVTLIGIGLLMLALKDMGPRLSPLEIAEIHHAFPPDRPQVIKSVDFDLLAAIRQVESGGDNYAVGDNGLARGPYQIHRAYWTDAIENHDVDYYNWAYEIGAHDLAKSTQAVLWYWDRYAPANASDAQKARIHNGGPAGHRKAATQRYWAKVRAVLDKGEASDG